MQRDRIAAAASVVLGLGMAANAVLGPLILGVIRVRESPSMETQLVGGELTSLFIAGPLAITAGVLWWRGSRLAPLLTFAPAGFAVYTYVQFVLAPDYSRYPGNSERWFPLYLALILCAWPLIWRSWTELAVHPPVPLSPRKSRMLGGALLVFNAAFALSWLFGIALVLAGRPPVGYQDDPTAFWLIRLMDLAFIIPVALMAGADLWRGEVAVTRAAYAVAGIESLIACAVAGMAIRMVLRLDPAGSWTMLAIAVGAAAALSAVYGSILHDAAVVQW